MCSYNAFPSLSNSTFSCHLPIAAAAECCRLQVPHPFLLSNRIPILLHSSFLSTSLALHASFGVREIVAREQGVGVLLVAAWKGPRPSDDRRSGRNDDDGGGGQGGSDSSSSNSSCETASSSFYPRETAALNGLKKLGESKTGGSRRDYADNKKSSNGASKSYVEESSQGRGRGAWRPSLQRKTWIARNAEAGGIAIKRNRERNLGLEKSSFRTTLNMWGQMLEEQQGNVQDSSPGTFSSRRSYHQRNPQDDDGNNGQVLQDRTQSAPKGWQKIPAQEKLSTHGLTANAQVLDKEEVALREALKIRRKNTAEALCAALQAAKMSPRYSGEVVAKMPAFVDQIMVEAVALKGDPKFATSSFASRARACIDRSQVVESIKWLKHNSVTMPRVGKLVDLKMENLQALCERVAWLKRIHVHGRDLGVVLTRQPCVLDRPQAELDELIELLERAGIRREWVGFVISRSPSVLSLSSQELIEKLSFFENLGVTPQQLGPMAFNFPASIGRFHLDEMQTKVEYFRRLGVADSNIGRAIASRPQLLACSIDEAWRPLVKYLRFLGVETAGLQRIICVNPSVFCFNLENNIAPKVRFLRAIGVHEEAIGKVIVEFPAFLSFSLDRKIRPVVRFLLETAGVTEENVGKVIALQPRLIGCSMSKKLQPAVEYFLNQKLRRDQLGAMVADFPMLLKYNVSIIKPKLEYFKRVLALPFDDLVTFPRYFSYSLQGRINPRYRILRGKGLMFNLRYMLACSDDLFNQRVEAALQGRSIEASDEVDDIEGYKDALGAHFPTVDDSVYAYAYHTGADDTDDDKEYQSETEEYGSETEGDKDTFSGAFFEDP